MKSGDVCWVWCSQAYRNSGLIEKGVISSVDKYFCEVNLRFRDKPYVFLKDEVFPTRKDLCEHYRKVFE